MARSRRRRDLSMHEFSIVMSMLDLAESSAREDGATRIDAIHLEIGALAGVVPEALEFAFQGAREGTMAEHARLEVDYLPAIANCSVCESRFELDNRWGSPCAPPAALRPGNWCKAANSSWLTSRWRNAGKVHHDDRGCYTRRSTSSPRNRGW